MDVIAVCGLVFLGFLAGLSFWLVMSDEDDPGSMGSYWAEDEPARGEYRSDRDSKD